MARQRRHRAIFTDRHDYSSTAVTSSAWVELNAGVGNQFSKLEIFDSSGVGIYLSTGVSGSESTLITIPPGGNGIIDVSSRGENDRLALKAVGTSATAGELIINGYMDDY